MMFGNPETTTGGRALKFYSSVRMEDVYKRQEAKGFTDVVVSITEDSCDVVLNMGEVTDAKRAQVEDLSLIHISFSAVHFSGKRDQREEKNAGL